MIFGEIVGALEDGVYLEEVDVRDQGTGVALEVSSWILLPIPYWRFEETQPHTLPWHSYYLGSACHLSSPP